MFDGTLKFDTSIDNNGFKSGIGNLGKLADAGLKAVKGLAIASTAAVTAGTVALTKLTKAAVSGYADYEQLTGGVETLFGAGGKSIEEYAQSVGKSVESAKGYYDKLNSAQSTVLANANNAYKTAGMSANKYMETVTSFSASLISSLGGDTVAAAAKADMAITDMADNVNKMGSNSEDVENAYKGFAKQNYTMLDNLKLGYGGTKGEMQRLLSDAEKFSGVKYDISSYSDVVDAIHVVQTEMGITGTTAKEASSTIQGSMVAMGAAWENFITGMADPKSNFDTLLNNLIDSVMTFADNIIPRIAATIPRLVSGISEVISKLAKYIPEELKVLIPAVMDGIKNITSAITEIAPELMSIISNLIPELISDIITIIPQFAKIGASLIFTIISGLTENLPQIADCIVKMINSISESLGNKDSVSKMIEGAGALFNGIIAAIPPIIEALINVLPNIISAAVQILTEGVPYIINGAIKLLMGIVYALPEIVKALTDSIPTLISGISDLLINGLPQIIDGAIQLLMGIVEALPTIIDALVNALPEIISTIITALISGQGEVVECGIQLLGALIKAIPVICIDIISSIPDIISAILNGLANGAPSILNEVSSIWETIKDVFSDVGSFLGGIWDEVADSATSGINWLIKKVESGINFLIQGLNDVGFDLPDVLGGDHIGFNIPGISLPRLAKGGIVDKPTIAQIGEAGTEAVLPLENNTGWIAALAQRICVDLQSSKLNSELTIPDSTLTAFTNQIGIAQHIAAAQPSATSEIVNNHYSYSSSGSKTELSQPQQPMTLNAQFIVGENVVADGVVDVISDKIDRRQGVKIQMKKRGI